MELVPLSDRGNIMLTQRAVNLLGTLMNVSIIPLSTCTAQLGK